MCLALHFSFLSALRTLRRGCTTHVCLMFMWLACGVGKRDREKVYLWDRDRTIHIDNLADYAPRSCVLPPVSCLWKIVKDVVENPSGKDDAYVWLMHTLTHTHTHGVRHLPRLKPVVPKVLPIEKCWNSSAIFLIFFKAAGFCVKK